MALNLENSVICTITSDKPEKHLLFWENEITK